MSAQCQRTPAWHCGACAMRHRGRDRQQCTCGARAKHSANMQCDLIESASRRQPSVAIDTAAAELFAASTCAQAILCISDVLMFLSFGALGIDATPLWIDNEACILIAKDATSIKRLAYMARRAAWMRELTDANHDVRQVVRPLKVDGTANPADALTKYLSKPAFRAYAARMYNCSEEGL